VPTSGTYLWSPSLADCVDDAFERCKVDPSTLDISHINSARRSIQFMLVEWAGDDLFHSFRTDRIIDFPLVQGTQQYVIDPDADLRIIDILQVALTRAQIDTTIYPMSRQEWLDIPDKDVEGRPSRYFADKRRDNVIVTLWTVPENSTDTLQMDVIRKFEDAGVGGSLEPDVPYYMREAFTAGLAGRLAPKFAPPQMIPYLEGKAEQQLDKANAAQRELGDVVIVPASNYLRRSGGRRR
jgi:hypothetical protein